MKYILFIIVMIQGILCHAVICKRVSGNTETDNRSVFQIQKDLCGYMWFLSYSGINRYDGTSLKRYELNTGNDSVAPYTYFYKLCTDSNKELWLFTEDGSVLSYNRVYDKFERYIDLQKEVGMSLSFLCMDNLDNVWFGSSEALYVCHLPDRKVCRINHVFGNISELLPIGNHKYCLSSESGVFSFILSGDTLVDISSDLSGGCYSQVYKMFYVPEVHRLIWADRSEGLGVYDCAVERLVYCRNDWKENRISCLKAFKERKVLIATEGVGIYCMDMDNFQISPFLNADFKKEGYIRSNRIADLYVDERQRVWVADFPEGVCVFNNWGVDRQKWYRHVPGDKQSLINDRINALLKDSEGDIWFATDNGISCYFPRTGRWKHITTDLPCRQYTALCEIAPGEVCAGNYMHGLFMVRKNEVKAGDKYADIPLVNVILQKDDEHLWVGTNTGLYLLNMKDRVWKPVELSGHRKVAVRALYQDKNAKLYIGTQGDGLFTMELQQEYAEKQVYGDIRNVSFILPKQERLLIGTDRNLYGFEPNNKQLEWLSCNVDGYLTSGLLLDDGTFMLGTSAGAFRFDNPMLETQYSSRPDIYLDNFSVFHQPVTTATKDSPLRLAINYTKVLRLNYNQNTFSFTVTSINYDAPEDIFYSWKLDNQAWTTPTEKNVVYLSNLTPGEHFVSIRALSAKNGNPVSQRNMQVIIHPPLWQTKEAFLCYGIIVVSLGLLFVRALLVWKERNLSRETIKVFINTAKEICMPLTLIKSPLESLCHKYSSETFKDILQQVKGMDHMFADLITIGRILSHPKKLSLLETELTMYLNDTIEYISPVVEQKKMKLHWDGTPGFLRVWIDKEKMTAILKGVLEIVVDCMDDGEEIELTTAYTLRSWEMKLEFNDNGYFKKKVYSAREKPASILLV